MSAKIQIQITPVYSGITAIATLIDGTYSVSNISDANGQITLILEKYGKFKIKYDDSHVKSLSTVIINNNDQISIEAKWSELVEYTIRIDTNNSNPTTCCEYLDDASDMTKGSTNWDSKPIFNNIKPCVFQNGKVNYYLNPNDFTKKADGTASVLTGADGDVMIEFWKFAYRIYKEGQYIYVSITNNFDLANADPRYRYDAFSRLNSGDLDMFYQGAFKGYIDSNNKLRSIAGVQPTASKNIQQFRAAAQANGNELTQSKHYQQATYSHLVALQCLYLIKYGSLNGQANVGKGIVSVTDGSTNMSYLTGYNGTSTSATTTFASGMDAGDKSGGVTHVKLFGIEDFWGNIWEWVDGFWTDPDWNINTSYTSGTTGLVSGAMKTVLLDPEGIDEEVHTFTTGLTANASGWNKVVVGNTTAGFMPIAWGGSSSTYWADQGYLSASCVLRFGGWWISGDSAGPFVLYANISASVANRAIGARLSYN